MEKEEFDGVVEAEGLSIIYVNAGEACSEVIDKSTITRKLSLTVRIKN